MLQFFRGEPRHSLAFLSHILSSRAIATPLAARFREKYARLDLTYAHQLEPGWPPTGS